MSGSLTFENMELKLLLEREFLIYTGSFEEAEYAKARRAIFVYEGTGS